MEGNWLGTAGLVASVPGIQVKLIYKPYINEYEAIKSCFKFKVTYTSTLNIIQLLSPPLSIIQP